MCSIYLCQSDIDDVKSENNDIKKSNKYCIWSEKNHVYFHEEVSKSTIRTLLQYLRSTQDYCNTTKNQLKIPDIPIYLHINSEGGDITPSMIAIDFIRTSKTPIYSVVEGECASAASLMSVVCHKRYILPNAYIMIHQMSCETGYGKLNEMTDIFNYYTNLDRRMKKIYLKHTKMTNEKLDIFWKQDKWFTAKKSIKYGLVDEIMR
jgi:ATP-dependent protease ClpP protease subunit